MKNFITGKNEAGQRLDKFIIKYLSKAPKSFIYKMLRKKNITLNDKKVSGSELLSLNDEIKFWLSDETFDKFKTDLRDDKKSLKVKNTERSNYEFDEKRIIYEDEHIILYNKQAGLLSQKSNIKDISLNELFISYLLKNNKISKTELVSFTPSICNRLDRNTSGLIILGKSFTGLQKMNELIRLRQVKKEYICLVRGESFKEGRYEAFLFKDEKNNKVLIKEKEFDLADKIDTEYKILYKKDGNILLGVTLHTGKTHQIRAHLSFLGFPIIGDIKYGKGDKKMRHQLLHSYKLSFGMLDGDLSYLSGRTFFAEPDEIYIKLMEGHIWEHGNQEG